MEQWNYLTLQENLARCYEQNLYVDAELKIQDKIFRAHRSILCFHSPVLRKAFYSTEVPATTCTIQEIKPEGFEILLRYLYTSEIPNSWKSYDLVEACYAAQKLQMVEIGEKLIHHILYRPRHFDRYSGKTIAQLQFWPLLEKCRLMSFGYLQEKLLKFAESNFTSVFNSVYFFEADIETIKLVLDRKFPSVPQRYVVESIARWVEGNNHLMFLEQYVRELLKCVDFKRLSPKEFYAVASKHDRLLSKKDSLDIQMHLVDPTVYPLPKWYQLDHKEITQTHNPHNESVCDSIRQAVACGMTLEDSFYQMLNEGLLTDVTLLANGNAKIPAHSLVLALQSEFFADVFYNSVLPSKTLCMEETAEEVKYMLRYFYGSGRGSIFGRSLNCVLRKTEMALKYLCYPLMQVCNDELLRMTLNPRNFWTLTRWVGRLRHSKVDDARLMVHATTSTKTELFEHDSFLKASKASLELVLKSDYLNMAEGDILEHVARWMEKNATQLPTDSSKRTLLRNIRFESLALEQFFIFLQKHDGLLPSQDSYEVLKFLRRQREEYCLPTWCYRGPPRSVFYDPSTKIGTNVRVPWLDWSNKFINLFRCKYKVTIRNKRPLSVIQFLELSLNFKYPPGKCSPDCSCSVTVMADALCLPKTFQDLKSYHQQRYLLPVYFHFDKSYNRSFKLVIVVYSEHYHNFYPVSKRALKFDNVTILPKSSTMNILCDAIVDGFTSENVPIPPHVLTENKNEAVTTEKCFKVMPRLD